MKAVAVESGTVRTLVVEVVVVVVDGGDNVKMGVRLRMIEIMMMMMMILC